MDEKEREEMLRASAIESRARKYAYVTGFPFTFFLISWLIIDNNSPDSAMIPILMGSAILNVFPMFLLQGMYEKIFSNAEK